jgi:predicted secreted protein
MSTNAIKSQGTVFKIGNGGGPETFTAIPEIVSFSGPGETAGTIDVTDLDSTAKEYIAGLKDTGTLSFDINYIPDNTVHAQIRTDMGAGTLRNFQIIFTDTGATQWDFAAVITGFSVSGATDDKVTASVSLQISGDITES